MDFQLFSSFITWDFDPAIFRIGDGGFEVRYYGLMWAASFLAGYMIISKMLKKEGLPEKLMDPLLYAVIIGSILGARFGEVFFYNWDYYKDHLAEIPNLRKGGLASHGGAIGLILAVSWWWYYKFRSYRTILWTLDRIVIAAALAAFFIRMGNFFNSEIVGIPTDVSWGVIFVERGEDFARHPAQLYEALSYLVIFFTLRFLMKKDFFKQDGKLLGLFMVTAFTMRFLIEFVKTSQGGLEESLGAGLSTGQMLSIPFVAVGLFFLFRKSIVSTKTEA